MDTDTDTSKEEQETIAEVKTEETETAPADTSSGVSIPSTDLASPISLLPMARMPTVPQLAVALGILALIFGLSYLPIFKNPETKKTEIVQEQTTHVAAAVEGAQYVMDVNITAGAAYVWDVKNQHALYNKNAGAQLPLASLTKLMTVLVAHEHLAPEDIVHITPEALLQMGDSAFVDGEPFSMRDLANLTLITSSNDGAYALALAGNAVIAGESGTNTFVAAMNAKAEEIGLSQSYFSNPTGLDVDDVHNGGEGSARDMAFLMEYLILKHPEILEGTKDTMTPIYDENGALFRAVNTNEVIRRIPGLIASKTGSTGLAGGNLVIAYDAGLNHPIVIVVLDSTRKGRFSDVMTLIKEATRAIAKE